MKLLQIVVVTMSMILVGGAASCSSDSSSPSPLYSTRGATKVSAQELFAAYANNKAAAGKLYKGRLLEVTGVMVDVGTDPIFNNAPEVMLSGGAMNQTLGVDCTFDKRVLLTLSRRNEVFRDAPLTPLASVA